MKEIYAEHSAADAPFMPISLGDFCSYCVSTFGFGVLYENISAAPTRLGRMRRTLHCIVTFVLCFVLLNRDLVFSQSSSVWIRTNWKEAPIGAIAWLLFSISVANPGG